ncbi:hypothetical protein [Saccharothrix deserti]|uniref:hypothetical protein n=1 Tax=Saccharothrix deserti TaxID=2593674 RepID=UPI00131ABE5D|nr:hypothetical protein [Saccharothrix deserti]
MSGGTVRSDQGFALGVVGGDVHRFADGVPVYVLRPWERKPTPPAEWLREPPSRMLDARWAVCPFTGRVAELAGLRAWLESGAGFGARWLHGVAGSGKTRLAAECAADARAAGWKVLVAVNGPGAVLAPENSSPTDLRHDGHVGVLVLVDYADRWPLSHLGLLLGNRALAPVDVPVRVLFVAREAGLAATVRELLAERESLAVMSLAPPGSADRRAMFAAAVRGFQSVYGTGPLPVAEPDALDRSEFGLALGIQMAALVGVDSALHGRTAPTDPTGTTIYLLDREQLHWVRRHNTDVPVVDGDREVVPARLAPELMRRTVVTAALTGPVVRDTGRAAVDWHDDAGERDFLLDEHGRCYPAATADTVLEPLYPDRLAEDLVALTVPGHGRAHPTRDWVQPTVARLLDLDQAVLTRLVVVLCSAASRWPHVARGVLRPLLDTDPATAVRAGTPALLLLADILDMDLLERVFDEVPEDPPEDLAPGVAAVGRRVLRHRLAASEDSAARNGLSAQLVSVLSRAGHFREAAAIQRDVVGRLRREQADPADTTVVVGLIALGLLWHQASVPAKADTAYQEAIAAYAALLGPRSASDVLDYAFLLAAHAVTLRTLDQEDRSGEVARAAVAVLETVPEEIRAAHPEITAGIFVTWVMAVLRDDSADEDELTRARAALAAVQPGDGKDALTTRFLVASRHRAISQAHDLSAQLLALDRALAEVNPLVHQASLVASLERVSRAAAGAYRVDEAVEAATEAVDLASRLVAEGREPGSTQASALTTLAHAQLSAKLYRSAVETADRAIGSLTGTPGDSATNRALLPWAIGIRSMAALALGGEADTRTAIDALKTMSTALSTVADNPRTNRIGPIIGAALAVVDTDVDFDDPEASPEDVARWATPWLDGLIAAFRALVPNLPALRVHLAGGLAARAAVALGIGDKELLTALVTEAAEISSQVETVPDDVLATFDDLVAELGATAAAELDDVVLTLFEPTAAHHMARVRADPARYGPAFIDMVTSAGPVVLDPVDRRLDVLEALAGCVPGLHQHDLDPWWPNLSGVFQVLVGWYTSAGEGETAARWADARVAMLRTVPESRERTEQLAGALAQTALLRLDAATAAEAVKTLRSLRNADPVVLAHTTAIHANILAETGAKPEGLKQSAKAVRQLRRNPENHIGLAVNVLVIHAGISIECGHRTNALTSLNRARRLIDAWPANMPNAIATLVSVIDSMTEDAEHLPDDRSLLRRLLTRR